MMNFSLGNTRTRPRILPTDESKEVEERLMMTTTRHTRYLLTLAATWEDTEHYITKSRAPGLQSETCNPQTPPFDKGLVATHWLATPVVSFFNLERERGGG